jgi:hypothetical protein
MTTALTTHNQDSRKLGFVESAAQTFEGVERIANMMAKMGTMPAHLMNKPADCFRVVVQAVKWGMDPFVVAECTSLVHGRMCYEGKLVAAVLQSLGSIEGRLEYDIKGTGQNAEITITGKPKGGKVQTLHGTVAQWRTTTKKDGQKIPNAWDNIPEDMLIYRGTRQWARRYAPEALLGVRTPDEFDQEIEKEVEATIHPAEPEPARTGQAPTGIAASVFEKPAEQTATKQETQKPPAEKPAEELHPAIKAANSLWATLQTYEKGLGKEVLERLARLNFADAPKNIKPDRLEQFGKDVDEVAKIGNRPAAIREALDKWEAEMTGGKP